MSWLIEWKHLLARLFRRRPQVAAGTSRDGIPRQSHEEHQYRELFEHGQGLICIHDLEGRLLEGNVPPPSETAIHLGVYRARDSKLDRDVAVKVLPSHLTANADALARFEREVDPEGVLPEAERLRRAGHARRAHMARLSYRSAKVRAERRQPLDAVRPSAEVDDHAAAE